MSTLSQFVSRSPIKSIQRGTINIVANNSSATATITAVDLAKTILNFGGSSSGGAVFNYGGSNWSASPSARRELTSSTLVTATLAMTTRVSMTTSYEVIEYF